MQHHMHPGLVGRLDGEGSALVPHPDAERDDARVTWFPIPDAAGREVDALEGLLCVPTRAGAARVVAVPHVAMHLALGDEVAVADWEGEPMARGELASSLLCTLRVVVGGDGMWDLAWRLDSRCEGACWFDVIGEQAFAASVPRDALGACFELLEREQAAGAVRWEYVTLQRHA